MKRLLANKTVLVPTIEVGTFTKKEAAARIAAGCRNIHSSPSGKKDANYRTSCLALKSALPKIFGWEAPTPTIEVYISSSGERHRIIQTISESILGDARKSLRQKAEGVLEELITNAVYHAYLDPDGREKYSRRDSIKLLDSEAIQLRCRADDNGVFIGIKDRGGHLVFENVRQTIERCYSGENEIQNKSGGAGLGMYMIFESVTHLKIYSQPGQFTEVTCWIADNKTHDPSVFSFNFFEGKQS